MEEHPLVACNFPRNCSIDTSLNWVKMRSNASHRTVFTFRIWLDLLGVVLAFCGLDFGSEDPGSIPRLPSPRVGPLMARR